MVFLKQPSEPVQNELVTPVPSSQHTVPAGLQPLPHGAWPTSHPTAPRVLESGGSACFEAHATTNAAAAAMKRSLRRIPSNLDGFAPNRHAAAHVLARRERHECRHSTCAAKSATLKTRGVPVSARLLRRGLHNVTQSGERLSS